MTLHKNSSKSSDVDLLGVLGVGDPIDKVQINVSTGATDSIAPAMPGTGGSDG